MVKLISISKRFTAIQVLALALPLMLLGCSNQSVFNTVKHNQQLECQKLPAGQYQKCMQENEQTFEEYEEDRQAVLTQDKN